MLWYIANYLTPFVINYVSWHHGILRSRFTISDLVIYWHSNSENNGYITGRCGEIIVNGLSFLKKDKSEVKETNSKLIESVCIKNKLTDKITFIISGKDAEDNNVKKEMVIQKDGKECVFELLKGIYTYEIVLSNKEVYKKGEYKFNEEITITVKPD